MVYAVLAFSGSSSFLGVRTSGQVLIGEVDAFGKLPDALGEGEDWIELNAGETASLQGMYLSDNADNWEKWALPDIDLLPDERLVICLRRDVGVSMGGTPSWMPILGVMWFPQVRLRLTGANGL